MSRTQRLSEANHSDTKIWITTGHRLVGVAAVLGSFFVVLHLVTIIVTCAVEGFDWGLNAWILDLLGYFAGIYFVRICRKSSNLSSADFRDRNKWIMVWGFASVCARFVDTLMLFGILSWSAVYTAPNGWVLGTNIVSEVLIGNAYSLSALVGSSMLYFCPADVAAESRDDLVIETEYEDLSCSNAIHGIENA